MAWLAFILGLSIGCIITVFVVSHAFDRMLSDRIDAGAMHHKAKAYRILPLEPPRVEEGE